MASVILELLRTIYGTMQAAMAFFCKLLKAFKFLKYNWRKSDPCLHYKWTEEGKLVMWLSWVDDCMVGRHGQDPQKVKEKMKQLVNCNDSGEVMEYIGTKVDVDKDNRTIRLTQPVLIQSFEDKFGVTANGKVTTPAAPGKTLKRCTQVTSSVLFSTRVTEKEWENWYIWHIGQGLTS